MSLDQGFKIFHSHYGFLPTVPKVSHYQMFLALCKRIFVQKMANFVSYIPVCVDVLVF